MKNIFSQMSFLRKNLTKLISTDFIDTECYRVWFLDFALENVIFADFIFVVFLTHTKSIPWIGRNVCKLSTPIYLLVQILFLLPIFGYIFFLLMRRKENSIKRDYILSKCEIWTLHFPSGYVVNGDGMYKYVVYIMVLLVTFMNKIKPKIRFVSFFCVLNSELLILWWIVYKIKFRYIYAIHKVINNVFTLTSFSSWTVWCCIQQRQTVHSDSQLNVLLWNE